MQSPHIDHYAFGRMTIDGKRHTSDLIILPDGTVRSNWWRHQGHNLIPADIADVLDAAPDLLIVGTGANGLMRVSDDLNDACAKRGIQLEMAPTGHAADRYNDARVAGEKVAACFHLTC